MGFNGSNTNHFCQSWSCIKRRVSIGAGLVCRYRCANAFRLSALISVSPMGFDTTNSRNPGPREPVNKEKWQF